MPDLDDEPTAENPRYSMFPASVSGSGRRIMGINVDEGWRSWILCFGVEEWAAGQLLARLEDSSAALGPWRHPAEKPAEGSRSIPTG